MFASSVTTVKSPPPGYDLNSIFRPYEMVPVQNPGGIKSPVVSEQASRVELKRDVVKTLFSIEISRLPKLVDDEPLMSWLLRAAQLVPDHVMRDALQVASKGEISPYEILRLSGRIAQSDLRALERAESFVTDGVVYRDFAAIALQYACTNFIQFEEALWDLSLHPNDPFGDFKLFELLDDCGLMPHSELLRYRRECLARGVTLGFGLMKNDVLSGQFLKVLLEALLAVQSKKFAYTDVVLTTISILRDADAIYGGDSSMTHEARLVAQLPILTADRALGNLLLCSHLMELEDLIFCLEVALEDERSLGAVLADFMLVDVVVLQAARSLAYMLCEKKITARRSVELLEEVQKTGMPLSQLFSEGNNVAVVNAGMTALTIAG